MRVSVRFTHCDPKGLGCDGPIPVEMGDGFTEPAPECPECGKAFSEHSLARIAGRAAAVAEERRMYERTGR